MKPVKGKLAINQKMVYDSLGNKKEWELALTDQSTGSVQNHMYKGVREMKRKSNFFMLMLILVLSMVMSGCGKKEDEQTTALADSSLETESTESGVSYGGSIVVGITQDLDSLDPHKAVAAGTSEVLFNIFEGLVKPDSDGNLVPAIAESYDISEDAMTYTFNLREGVKFHNGEEVTAEDVVYSIKRCAGLLDTVDESVSQISALSVISEINILDEKTVEVKLSEPDSELINYMTFAIIPEDYTEQETSPVGTGPYKFVSYEPLGSFVIAKNEEYWGDEPYLDQVTFKIFSSTDAAFMELLAGSVDIFPYLTESQASQLSTDYNIEVGSSNLVQALFLNNAAEPFDNVLVRQALCYAVDRQAILDFVAGGKGSIIGSNMFPNFKAYFDEDLVDYYPHDVEKAKELLAEAGYEDGFAFTITVPSNYDFHVSTAQVIVEQLKEVGITAEIQLVEWATWLDDVYRGRNYEATIIGLDSDLAPGDIMRRYNSDASNNFVNYNNAEYDRIYQLAKATVDENEKVDYYNQLQTLLTEDAASVYIQDPAKMVAVNKKLSGYLFYPVYVQDMSTIYYVGE